MANNRIKVFARLKNEAKLDKRLLYEIVPQNGYDILQFFQGNTLEGRTHNFRFSKVFNTSAEQQIIFENIAKPIITSALNGLNGTIFAYGQTGSGKTYSLTGSHNKFEKRGIIPRTIEYIFKYIEKNPTDFHISISYLEIYNEVAYDLLNPKGKFSILEELPRVVLLEDDKGQAHFKNLIVKPVFSEREAMKLLFLGDTNRTIAETPMNEYSTRSHCVFTLYIVSKNKETRKYRKSKLNLVDLAGSERFCKSITHTGNIKEVKYINLSLYYLERVIIALSESKRGHIPYRNSLMTLILRDSLDGNCLTAMLATLNVLKPNFIETLTTCRFSQRVASVRTEPTINVDSDTKFEIENMRNEIESMRRKLDQKEIKEHVPLKIEEEEECKQNVKNYVNGYVDDLNLEDPRRVKLYIKLLKDEVLKRRKSSIELDIKMNLEEKYREILAQKDKEISLLRDLYDDNVKKEEEKFCVLFNNAYVTFTNLRNSEKIALEEFLSNSRFKSQLECRLKTISDKYEQASNVSSSILEAQHHITDLKKQMEHTTNPETLEELSFLLKTEQNSYKELLLKLENIKSEMEYLKNNLKFLKIKIMEEFRNWFQNQDKLKILYRNHPSLEMKSKECMDSSSNVQDNYMQPREIVINKTCEENNRTDKSIKKCIENQCIDSTSNQTVFLCSEEVVDRGDCKLEDTTKEINGKNTQKNDVEIVRIENDKQTFSHTAIQILKPPITSTSNRNILKPSNSLLNKLPESKAPLSKVNLNETKHYLKYIQPSDTEQFKDFLKKVPMTGDFEVDDEIVKFYRIKFRK